MNTLTIPSITIKTRTCGDISLEPVRMGKLKQFSDAVEPMIGEIMAMVDGAVDQTVITKLIRDHYDSALHLVTLLCPATKEQLDDMLLDEFVEVVGAAVEINTDFFVQSLLPAVLSKVGKLKSMLATMTGTMASSASLPTDTATDASVATP
ncbi:MAG: hypothetical protein VXW65_15060 [Pseudomonadota bacterium]|nr:hypothetical protein [Pseudomonadota bacterium]